MKRREIDGQFDSIVDFAGVERFLDTPVKRYSSGMYVRLAFAVAAHLETEILLLDEVLAVGDAEFQERCLNKMMELARSGRAVVFVSHQLRSITSTCDSALLLGDGRIVRLGAADAVVEEYLTRPPTPPAAADPRRGGTGEARITRCAPVQPVFGPSEPKQFIVQVDTVDPDIQRYFVSFHLRTAEGSNIAHVDSSTVTDWFDASHQTNVIGMSFTTPWLLPGRYEIDAFVCNAGVIDALPMACTFDVHDDLPYPHPPDAAAITRDTVLPDYAFTLLETARFDDKTCWSTR